MSRSDDEDNHLHPFIEVAKQTGVATGKGDLAQLVNG
jgi:hypothetical protein